MASMDMSARLRGWLERPGAKRLHREECKLPTYAELCLRSESHSWHMQSLDFRLDREQWRTLRADEEQTWTRRLLGIFRGEVLVAEALGVYMTALARQDQGRYIATQVQDEVRHAGLFERFHREVQDIQDEWIEHEREPTGCWTDRAYRALIAENLPTLCTRLRADPRDQAALIEAVTLLHVLIEGGLGMARLKTVVSELENRRLFPALRQGLALAGRDEVRHFLFGLRFLHDALVQEPAHLKTVVDVLATRLPLVVKVLGRAQESDQALRRLQRGLHSAGLEVPLV